MEVHGPAREPVLAVQLEAATGAAREESLCAAADEDGDE
jgi:hypothetical protein